MREVDWCGIAHQGDIDDALEDRRLGAEADVVGSGLDTSALSHVSQRGAQIPAIEKQVPRRLEDPQFGLRYPRGAPVDQSRLGYEETIEFVEGGVLMGVGMRHP